MCGFCNVRMCVCVGFVMCMCVCVGFVMCGCFRNSYVYLYLTCFCIVSFIYIYSLYAFV